MHHQAYIVAKEPVTACEIVNKIIISVDTIIHGHLGFKMHLPDVYHST